MPQFEFRFLPLLLIGIAIAMDAEGQTTLVSPNPELFGIFGVHVANVPDITGDGREEIAVATYLEDPGASPDASGRVYLYNGATGVLLRTLTSPNEESGGNFGSAVAGIADMNGDGRGDVVVGAPGESPGASPDDAGRVYLINGNTGAILRTFTSPNEELSGLFGSNLDTVPDVTGDGLPDIVVGAYDEDPGASPNAAGRAYIFNGMTGGLVATLNSANEENGGRFGLCVTGIADVTGDLLGDVVVGASFEDRGIGLDEAGRAYVFNGATGALVRTLLSPNPCQDGSFGSSAEGLGDITGDGRSEIAIGAYLEDIPPFFADYGRVYIFNGASGVLMTSLASPNGDGGGSFGHLLSTVSDLSGDGRPDLLIGAPQEDPGTSPTSCGRAYLFDPYYGNLLHTFISPNQESTGYFGFGLTAINDLTGDGADDFVIGAFGETPPSGFTLGGRVYIFSSVQRNASQDWASFE